MTVEAGAILIIDEAVNIYNYGPVTINGTPDNPVLVTCAQKGKYWGGFISTNSAGTINAGYTIFCQSL